MNLLIILCILGHTKIFSLENQMKVVKLSISFCNNYACFAEKISTIRSSWMTTW